MSRPLPHDGDQLPTELGRPLPRPEPPKPGYTPTETPGVYKAPDGKLITAIPENERARWAQPHSFCGVSTGRMSCKDAMPWPMWAAEQERLRTIRESMLAQDYGPLEVRVFVVHGEMTTYCGPRMELQNIPKEPGDATRP